MSFTALISEKSLKPTNSSLVRFLLVGIVNTLVGLMIMFLLLHIAGFSYWTSTFTGNAAGAFVSFLLNRSFTFKSDIPVQKGLPKFLTIILICYFFSYFVSEQLTEQFSYVSPSFGQNVAVLIGSVLYTISNYLGQKYFVFGKVQTAKEFS